MTSPDGLKYDGSTIRLLRNMTRKVCTHALISTRKSPFPQKHCAWLRGLYTHQRIMANRFVSLVPVSNVSSSRTSFDTKAGIARWICTSGLRFALQFWHAKTPVFTYPRGWFPWYVEWILGFPRCPYGGVSINVWSTACGTVITLVSDLIVYVVQYVQERNGSGQKEQAKEKVPVSAAQKSR